MDSDEKNIDVFNEENEEEEDFELESDEEWEHSAICNFLHMIVSLRW